MTAGGSRNRNGSIPDPKSGRSDRRGVALTALPTSYDGPVPEFPLPDASEREVEVWFETWRLPQANAWSLPSEEWRLRTVAMWVRTAVRCEDPKVQPTVLASLHRLADQVGLTTAGLAEIGWRVAADEVAAKAVAREPKVPVVRRLRAANSD